MGSVVAVAAGSAAVGSVVAAAGSAAEVAAAVKRCRLQCPCNHRTRTNRTESR